MLDKSRVSELKSIMESLKSTHMAIGAHPDDVEIMGFHGISKCLEDKAKSFTAVVMTSGGGSPRSGKFSSYSDEQMVETRAEEQRHAARLGKYKNTVMFGFKSSDIKKGLSKKAVELLKKAILEASPEVIYTHNPFDKHATHISVTHHVVEALRELKAEKKFSVKELWGCEVWRDLDWLPNKRKKILSFTPNEKLELELIKAHASQVDGGKNYDIATVGRRRANATFQEYTEVDEALAATLAIDLLPLVNSDLRIKEFVETVIAEFKEECVNTLNELGLQK